MEYLQVFNGKKEMLNEKIARSEKFDLPDGKYFMIVLIFIENSNHKFLMQKTSKEKHSCIATTGGHVTYGDDGLKTAIKEVKEELSLDLKEEELNYIDTLSFNKGYVEVYYVNKEIDINTLDLQKEEVESVSWYSVDEIKELIKNGEFRSGNIKPFEMVLKFVKFQGKCTRY